MRALREAVEETIPAGRVFLLGTTEAGPILGSIVSGVGLVDDPHGVQIVRVDQQGSLVHLGRLMP
jgi:hypothetical protein